MVWHQNKRARALQNVLDEASGRLSHLRSTAVACKPVVDEDDPDDVAALAALTLDVARALDPLFHEISVLGGVGSRSGASVHAAYVTNAVAGNLDFDLRDRAEHLASRHHRADPNDEHRLSAAGLGVGRWR